MGEGYAASEAARLKSWRKNAEDLQWEVKTFKTLRTPVGDGVGFPWAVPDTSYISGSE